MSRSRRSRTSNKREIIYGLHAVESFMAKHAGAVVQCWVQQGRADDRLGRIIAQAQANGISVETISSDKLAMKADGAVHQGIVAAVTRVESSSLSIEDLLERDSLMLLVLDEVQDPHNIGACLRTADAVGVDAVVVSKNRSPGLTAAVRKVSSGAADTVPFIQVSNLARALQQCRDAGVWILGATGSGDADCSLYDVQVDTKLALVMGSEGKGMRRLTREHCDQLIAIPMEGEVESLNVSVATGVCLYELRRRVLQR